MNQQHRTVNVQGHAKVRQRPSHLLLIGSLVAERPTLELALGLLRQKREAVHHWPLGLGAERVEFAVPRLPEQAEFSPLRASKKLMSQALRRSESSERVSHNKKVLMGFQARWPVDGKSDEELLLLADRLLFDVGDQSGLADERQDESHSRLNWDDPVGKIQKLISQVASSNDEAESGGTHFLFLSSLEGAAYDDAVARAYQDGLAHAQTVARATGSRLGELLDVRMTPMSAGLDHVNQIQRRTHMPMLFEAPLSLSSHQRVSENPQTAEFEVVVSLTFAVEASR